MTTKREWKGPFRCPDCPRENDCTKDCSRRFARDWKDFMDQRRD